MGFSTKAKVTMAAGLSIACIFLVLGIRQFTKPHPLLRPAVTLTPERPTTTTTIAAANRAIDVGETITAGLIRSQAGTPERNPSIATPAEVIGKVANRPISAGALIDRTMIGNESKLAIRVPVGMRAMSIDTTAEIAVAGLIRPGDRVDVQVIYPGQDAISGARGTAGHSRAETLLQMVPVLAVGDLVIGARDDGGGSGNVTGAPPPPPVRTVTLALTPKQVSTLSLAKNIGGLYLSLRNPTDQAVTSATGTAGPAAASEPARATAAPRRAPRIQAGRPAGQPIELVIGDQHEIIRAGSGAK